MSTPNKESELPLYESANYSSDSEPETPLSEKSQFREHPGYPHPPRHHYGRFGFAAMDHPFTPPPPHDFHRGGRRGMRSFHGPPPPPPPGFDLEANVPIHHKRKNKARKFLVGSTLALAGFSLFTMGRIYEDHTTLAHFRGGPDMSVMGMGPPHPHHRQAFAIDGMRPHHRPDFAIEGKPCDDEKIFIEGGRFEGKHHEGKHFKGKHHKGKHMKGKGPRPRPSHRKPEDKPEEPEQPEPEQPEQSGTPEPETPETSEPETPESSDSEEKVETQEKTEESQDDSDKPEFKDFKGPKGFKGHQGPKDGKFKGKHYGPGPKDGKFDGKHHGPKHDAEEEAGHKLTPESIAEQVQRNFDKMVKDAHNLLG